MDTQKIGTFARSRGRLVYDHVASGSNKRKVWRRVGVTPRSSVQCVGVFRRVK